RGDERFNAMLVTFALLVLFVLCIFLHEVGHAIAARRLGLVVERITLNGFVAVAHVEGRRLLPRNELLIALAGPFVNIVLGALFAAFLLLPRSTIAVVDFFGLLVIFNFGFAIINLVPGFLPGFPLDGGRALRAALSFRRTHARATYVAATVAWWVAAALMLVSVVVLRDGIIFAFAFLLLLGAWIEKQKARLLGVFDQLADTRRRHEERVRREAEVESQADDWTEEATERERHRIIDVEAGPEHRADGER
ncbi:MAG TPA: site-2 protease family protein, partial [Planctomycetota bacterium]|nr:site-2 protease family protein [Planctomycetota bacterium]